MKNANTNEAAAVPREKVTLIKDGHTHQGRLCAKGEVIEVTARQKAFLQQQGVIAGGKTNQAEA